MPRYDVAKLGPTRSFRDICIGNTPKNGLSEPKKKLKKVWPKDPNMAIFGEITEQETKNL